jgi:hypothetical protein
MVQLSMGMEGKGEGENAEKDAPIKIAGKRYRNALLYKIILTFTI